MAEICPVVEFHENVSSSSRPCLLYMKRHLNIVCCLGHKKLPECNLIIFSVKSGVADREHENKLISIQYYRKCHTSTNETKKSMALFSHRRQENHNISLLQVATKLRYISIAGNPRSFDPHSSV